MEEFKLDLVVDGDKLCGGRKQRYQVVQGSRL